MKIERGAVRFWRRREMGLLCCRLKIERKWGEDRLRVERKMGRAPIGGVRWLFRF